MRWHRWLTAVVMVMGVGTGGAWAQPAPDEARELAARAAERIRTLQREADQLAAQARTIFNDLRKLELERAIAQQRVAEADAALRAVTSERDASAERVERLEAARVAGTPGVEERLVSIYKRGRGGYARLLLSSDDPRAFGRLTRGVASIATLDQVRLDAHRRTLQAERQALDELEARRDRGRRLATCRVAGAGPSSTRRCAPATRQSTASTSGATSPRDTLPSSRRRSPHCNERSGLSERRRRTSLSSRFAGPSTGPSAVPSWRASVPLSIGDSARRSRETASRSAPPKVRRCGRCMAGSSPSRRHSADSVPWSSSTMAEGRSRFTATWPRRASKGEPGCPAAGVVGTVGLAPAGSAALYFEVRVDGRPADPLQWLRSSP